MIPRSLECYERQELCFIKCFVFDEGNNPVDNPNIYNVEGDNRLYLDLQQVVAAVFKPRQTEVCRTSGFFCLSGSAAVFSKNGNWYNAIHHK
jgi:hypothetical protein